jgi:hypothetical protein
LELVEKLAALQDVDLSGPAEEPTFTSRNSKEYRPSPLVKRAELVTTHPDGTPIGPGEKTTITPEWGGTQDFYGPWMRVVNDKGEQVYGSDLKEWNENNERVPDTKDGWVKITPVTAFQHKGRGLTTRPGLVPVKRSVTKIKRKG